jgi:hypothetical protein
MKKLKIFLAAVTILTLIFHGCKKDDDPMPPAISLKSGEEFTKNGAVVEVGGKLFFGIQARGTDANLTNFTVKKHLQNGEIITVMDTGLNAAVIDINKIFYQNVEDTAEWVFTVMDRNRLQSSGSLMIYKDPNSSFGGIYHYEGITMGYQENNEYGHFLDPATAEVYFEDSAALFQERMDILVYYIVDEDLPSPVFSSPGEMDNFSIEAQEFYPTIVNWETRNYTLWDISVDDDPVPAEDFNNCHNDSLLIVSYDEVWGKKKFKWATNGRVIPFMTGSGKKGLIRVNNADHSKNGTINFDIKIQQ